jgi:hypothetical protein
VAAGTGSSGVPLAPQGTLPEGKIDTNGAAAGNLQSVWVWVWVLAVPVVGGLVGLV